MSNEPTAEPNSADEATSPEDRPSDFDDGEGVMDFGQPPNDEPMPDRLSAGDSPPDGAIAHKDDFLIQRDENRQVIPIWQRIPGTKRYAQVRPLSNAEAEARLPADGNALSMDDDKLLELLGEKFVQPDLSDAESLEDIRAFGIEPLIMCLNEASGFEMMRGIVSENSELAELARAVEGNSRGGNSGRRRSGSSSRRET